MTSPISPEAVAQMVADLTHTDGPNGEMSMLYRGVIADALATLAAENATLRASEAAALERVRVLEGVLQNEVNRSRRHLAASTIAALTPTADPTEYERKVAQMKKDFPNGI